MTASAATPTNPAVVALFAALRAALPAPPSGDPVDMLIGPAPTGHPFAGRALHIAASFDEDLDAITVEPNEHGAVSLTDLTVSVACSLYVGVGGEPDFDAWRADADQLMQTIDDTLRTDPTLRETVARARRGYTRQIPRWQDPGGIQGVIVDFVVDMTILG